MAPLTLDLSTLEIHRLDVDPRTDGDAVEFQLHATLHDLDDGTLAALAGKSFDPDTVTGSVYPTPRPEGDELTSPDEGAFD